MARSTMPFWLHECPSCGYVAEDISEIDEPTSTLIASVEFEHLQNDQSLKGLELKFLKRGYLDSELGDSKNAALHFLYAAWATDDAGNQFGAKKHRSKAASFFLQLISQIPQTSEDFPLLSTQHIDVYRRAGEWDKAISVANDLLNTELNETVRAVVKFEKRLATNEDNDCYTIEDALK